MSTATTISTLGATDYTVPAGVYSLQVECYGCQGNTTSDGTYGEAGGKGGYVKARIPVTPGEVLHAYLGRNPYGTYVSESGAADVRQGGTALSSRVVVAGGGGGASYYTYSGAGGAGGGLTGSPGGGGSLYGQGGTQTAGGAGASGHPLARAGAFGVGGDAETNTAPTGSGAGGDGWYGGGGGAGGTGGGGGGSGYAISTATAVTMTNGVQSGTGKIVLTVLSPDTPMLLVPNGTVLDDTRPNDLPWSYSDPSGASQASAVVSYWTLDGTGARVGAATTVNITGAAHLWSSPGATFAAGPYEWQVVVTATDGLSSAASSSGFFTAAPPTPAPTITDPAAGATIPTTDYTATITSAAAVDASEWTLYADNAGVISSTVIQGPFTVSAGDRLSYAFTGLTNHVPVWLSVRVRANALWSSPTQRLAPVEYTTAMTPLVTLAEDPATGKILVLIDNPTPGSGVPDALYNNVWVTDPGEAEERRAYQWPINTGWPYWLPPAGFDGITVGLIRVETVAANGTSVCSGPPASSSMLGDYYGGSYA